MKTSSGDDRFDRPTIVEVKEDKAETPSTKRRAIPVDVTWRSMGTAIMFAAGVWLFIKLLPVVLVLIVALFLVGTLNPIAEWLERRGARRTLAIATVFFALFIATVLVGVITVPSLVQQVRKLIEDEPAIRQKLIDAFSKERLTAPLAESLRNMRSGSIAQTAASTALAYSTRVLETVAYGVSSIFLALYLMIDRDRVRGGLFAVVPRSHHLRLSRVLLNLEVIVGGYIRGQVITSALMVVFVFILLTACGVKNAVAIAVFAGLADILPYVGAILSIGPAVLAALPRGSAVTLIVLVAFLAYEEFESRVLVPRIYGRALRLPSAIVLLSLLAGGTLGGILGALLALPFAAALRMLVEELRVALPGEAIDDAPLRERDERAEQEYAARTEGVDAEKAAAIAVDISDERRKEEADNPEDAAEVPITGGRK